MGVFPEPFLVDDTDLEDGEIKFDWLHTARGSSSHTDELKVELEKSFGLVTFELEVPYLREVDPEGRVEGMGNIELSARVPFLQFVNQSKTVDTTFGVAMEWAIATGAELSKNGELVPKLSLFNDTRLGNHVTIQSILGLSFVTGPE